jgi:hypothetical protein
MANINEIQARLAQYAPPIPLSNAYVSIEKDENGNEFATVQLVVDKGSAIDGVFEWNPSLFDGLGAFMNNGSVSVQVLCSVS